MVHLILKWIWVRLAALDRMATATVKSLHCLYSQGTAQRTLQNVVSYNTDELWGESLLNQSEIMVFLGRFDHWKCFYLFFLYFYTSIPQRTLQPAQQLDWQITYLFLSLSVSLLVFSILDLKDQLTNSFILFLPCYVGSSLEICFFPQQKNTLLQPQEVSCESAPLPYLSVCASQSPTFVRGLRNSHGGVAVYVTSRWWWRYWMLRCRHVSQIPVVWCSRAGKLMVCHNITTALISIMSCKKTSTYSKT